MAGQRAPAVAFNAVDSALTGRSPLFTMADPSPDPDSPEDGRDTKPPVRTSGRRRRIDGRTVAISVCVALVVALAAAVVTSFVTDDSPSTAGKGADSTSQVSLTPVNPKAPKTLPGDPIEGLVGYPFRFSDFVGKPLLVNFFSSTCAPCVKEMPGFEQLHQQLGNQVTFVGIDVTDTKAAGRGLVARTGVTYKTGFDPQGNVLRDLDGQGLPTTVVIDAQGQVVDARTGALTPDALRALLDQHQLLPAAPVTVLQKPTTATAATPTTAQ